MLKNQKIYTSRNPVQAKYPEYDMMCAGAPHSSTHVRVSRADESWTLHEFRRSSARNLQGNVSFLVGVNPDLEKNLGDLALQAEWSGSQHICPDTTSGKCCGE